MNNSQYFSPDTLYWIAIGLLLTQAAFIGAFIGYAAALAGVAPLP